MAVAVLAATIIAPFASGGSSHPAEAQDTRGATPQADLPEGLTVTAAPTNGVTDGQRMVVTVKTTPDYPVYEVRIRLCRPDVDYQPSAGDQPDRDYDLGGANCPDQPVSVAGDFSVIDGNTTVEAASPGGNVSIFRAASGTIKWPSSNPVHTLSCDVDNPCWLVVEVYGGLGVWTPWIAPVTYQVADPVGGCGGPSEGVLATGGSDRMADAWVGWTLGECGQTDRAGAAGRAAFLGEGKAVTAFDRGTLDLAYSGVGYDEDAHLVEPDKEAPDAPPRASVPVPLALNATVLAVGGGGLGPQGEKVPFSDIKLTLDEVTAFMSGGAEGIRDLIPEINARNPELRRSFFDPSDSGFGAVAGAFAEADGNSWFMTRHLDTLRPDKFVVPQNPTQFGPDAGKPRDPSAWLALASPSYAKALALQTGRPNIEKTMDLAFLSAFSGGMWLFTDLATATALGLTIVQIENANGAFVAPTPATMAAAVPTMTTDDAGMLTPDPRAVGAQGGVQPYPLTFVEYGIAPAEPLADEANVCRSTSQAILTDWLTYVTTDGQQTLPSGMEPLPDELAATTADQIALVGATPAATPCTASATPPTTVPPAVTPTGGSDFSGGGSSGSGGGVGGGQGSGSSGSGSGSDEAELALDQANAELAASTTDAPGFVGSHAASIVLALIAMLGLAGITYVGIAVSSGKRPSFLGLRRGT